MLQAMSQGEWVVGWVLGGVTTILAVTIGMRILAAYKPAFQGFEAMVGFLLLAAIGFWGLLEWWSEGAFASWISFLLLVIGAALASHYANSHGLKSLVCFTVAVFLVVGVSWKLFQASGIAQGVREWWNQPTEEIVAVVSVEDVEAGMKAGEEAALRAAQARGGGTGATASVPIQVSAAEEWQKTNLRLTGGETYTVKSPRSLPSLELGLLVGEVVYGPIVPGDDLVSPLGHRLFPTTDGVLVFRAQEEGTFAVRDLHSPAQAVRATLDRHYQAHRPARQ